MGYIFHQSCFEDPYQANAKWLPEVFDEARIWSLLVIATDLYVFARKQPDWSQLSVKGRREIRSWLGCEVSREDVHNVCWNLGHRMLIRGFEPSYKSKDPQVSREHLILISDNFDVQESILQWYKDMFPSLRSQVPVVRTWSQLKETVKALKLDFPPTDGSTPLGKHILSYQELVARRRFGMPFGNPDPVMKDLESHLRIFDISDIDAEAKSHHLSLRSCVIVCRAQHYGADVASMSSSSVMRLYPLFFNTFSASMMLVPKPSGKNPLSMNPKARAIIHEMVHNESCVGATDTRIA